MSASLGNSEVQRWTHALCEGTISPDEHHQLDRRVCDDPAARAEFIEYMALHSALRWHNHHGTLSAPAVEPRGVSTPDSTPRLWRQAWAAANRPLVFSLTFAASFLFASLTLLAIIQLRTASTPRTEPAAGMPLALVSAANHCVWASGAVGAAPGAALPRGRLLQLESGNLELTLPQGVRLILQGPTELQLDSPTRVTLRAGAIWAQVAKNASGFTIETPDGRVIDRGTEFGVVVSDSGSEVHVQQGQVEVVPQLSDQVAAAPRRVGAGEALGWLQWADGVAWTDTPPRPEQFVRSAADLRPPRPRLTLAPQNDLRFSSTGRVDYDHALLSGRDQLQAEDHFSLLQFNPPDATLGPNDVRVARLRLYLVASQRFGSAQVTRLTQTWNASDPLASLQETAVEPVALAGSIRFPDGRFQSPLAGRYYSADVTRWVQQWLQQPTGPLSLRLAYDLKNPAGESFTNTLREFSSSRGPHAPQLVLELHESAEGKPQAAAQAPSLPSP